VDLVVNRFEQADAADRGRRSIAAAFGCALLERVRCRTDREVEVRAPVGKVLPRRHALSLSSTKLAEILGSFRCVPN